VGYGTLIDRRCESESVFSRLGVCVCVCNRVLSRAVCVWVTVGICCRNGNINFRSSGWRKSGILRILGSFE